MVALFATTCGGTAPAARSNSISFACEVAAAYVQIVISEAKNRPVVFTTNDEPFNAPLAGGEWSKRTGELQQVAAPPPVALVKRLEDRGNLNAVSRCLSVRKLLKSHHIGYGPEAVDAVNSPDPSQLFKASIHTISVPVVSANGKQAVLASSSVSGLLAGAGFLHFLERQSDGSWTVVAFSLLWVA